MSTIECGKKVRHYEELQELLKKIKVSNYVHSIAEYNTENLIALSILVHSSAPVYFLQKISAEFSKLGWSLAPVEDFIPTILVYTLDNLEEN